MLRFASKSLLGLGLASQEAAAPSSRPLQILPRFYHENVIDHYDNPRNVGTGLVGSPACADVMKLQIKVDPRTGNACFKTFGIGLDVDIAPAPAVRNEGMKLLQIKIDEKGNIVDVCFIKTFGCDLESPVPGVDYEGVKWERMRQDAIKDTIKAAVKDYEAKRAKSNGSSDAAPVEKAAVAAE